MALNTKLKDETSRTIATLLVSALESCRQGDVELVEGLGLSIETMQLLDMLKADQISSISGNYVRDICILEVFKIDATKISKIIEIAAEETKRYEMIDEYLRRGACKVMMNDLFGMRSTQVSNRKKFLKIKTVKGRLPVSTIKEQRHIYDAWLESSNISDYRERLLYIAKTTNLSMSKIYREVKEIEVIEHEFTKIRAIKGQLPISTSEEQKKIFDAWLDSIKSPDYHARLLYVARKTNLSMTKIYHEVKEIEVIENHNHANRKAYA